MGITSRRYHKRPSLPATVYDVLAASIVAVPLIRRHGLKAVHARNHVRTRWGFSRDGSPSADSFRICAA
jgi:hypothetical protein